MAHYGGKLNGKPWIGLFLICLILVPSFLVSQESPPEVLEPRKFTPRFWAGFHIGTFSGGIGSMVDVGFQPFKKFYLTLNYQSSEQVASEGSESVFSIMGGPAFGDERFLLGLATGVCFINEKYYGNEIAVPLQMQVSVGLSSILALSVQTHFRISEYPGFGFSLGLQLGKFRGILSAR